MSQKQLILEHLMNGHSITPLEALDLFKCFRLGARIWDLKKDGHDIKSELFYDERTDKHYEKYWIEPESQPSPEPKVVIEKLSPEIIEAATQLQMQF